MTDRIQALEREVARLTVENEALAELLEKLAQNQLTASNVMALQDGNIKKVIEILKGLQ